VLFRFSSPAIESLKAGCGAKMDEDERSRLAVRFTNCQLSSTGLTTYRCTDNMTIAECTRPMVESQNSIAYRVYTTYVTHTDSLCFHLQGEAFELRAESAVHALYASSRDAASRLGDLGQEAAALAETTAAVRSDQLAAAESASALLREQRTAAAELDSLQEKQASAFERAEGELLSLATRSRAALLELQRDAAVVSDKQKRVERLLDRLLHLQRALLGEISDVQSAFVYAVTLVLITLLTSGRGPASRARLPCAALMVVTWMCEKGLVRLAQAADAPPEACWGWRWHCRRLACALALILLLRCALRGRAGKAAAASPLAAAIQARQRRRVCAFSAGLRRPGGPSSTTSTSSTSPPHKAAVNESHWRRPYPTDQELTTAAAADEPPTTRTPSQASEPRAVSCATPVTPEHDSTMDMPALTHASPEVVPETPPETSGDPVSPSSSLPDSTAHAVFTDEQALAALAIHRLLPIETLDEPAEENSSPMTVSSSDSCSPPPLCDEQSHALSCRLARPPLQQRQPPSPPPPPPEEKEQPLCEQPRVPSRGKKGLSKPARSSPQLTTRSGRVSLRPVEYWVSGRRVERTTDGSYAVDSETGHARLSVGGSDYTGSFQNERDFPRGVKHRR
jgi:hypothetical protein